MSEAQKAAFDRLDLLAAKLGVAADRLWAALLRQQYIDGVMTLLWIMTISAALIYGYKAMCKWETTYSHAEFAMIGPKPAKFLVVAFAAVVLPVLLSLAVTSFLNPEYAALKTVLDTVRR